MKKPSPRVLIKLGGAALTESTALQATTEAIKAFRTEGYDVILVHGGGPAINAELQARGIEWSFVNGQRVTTPLMMKSIESTLCGVVNRSLVRHFGAQGIDALGFSGVDHSTLVCCQASPELGLVGKIMSVNAGWISEILNLPTKPLPVIAPLGVGAGGECYNINADWSASHLAVALGVEQLLFLTDQPGILDEEGKVIHAVDVDGLGNLIEAKMVTGGMMTKTNAVIYALKNGVSLVRVMNAQNAAEDVPVGKLGTQCVLNHAPLKATPATPEALRHVAI
jgi:acetylglutamate kinase